MLLLAAVLAVLGFLTLVASASTTLTLIFALLSLACIAYIAGQNRKQKREVLMQRKIYATVAALFMLTLGYAALRCHAPASTVGLFGFLTLACVVIAVIPQGGGNE